MGGWGAWRPSGRPDYCRATVSSCCWRTVTFERLPGQAVRPNAKRPLGHSRAQPQVELMLRPGQPVVHRPRRHVTSPPAASRAWCGVARCRTHGASGTTGAPPWRHRCPSQCQWAGRTWAALEAATCDVSGAGSNPSLRDLLDSML
eukprot:scaffold13655_cov114-Isochrysis_galbana.AAC.3